jgi:hypothetical protein
VNKRFLQAVLAQRPDLGALVPFFFYQPVADIVSGFVVERTRSFARISSFAVPLFDHTDLLHLTFGDVLPIEANFLRSESPVASAKTFVRVISPFEAEVRSLADPARFLDVAQARIGNPWAQRAIMVTLAWHGALPEARRRLAELEPSAHLLDHYPHWGSDLRQMREAFDAGHAATHALLDRWQRETRARFNIPPR